MAIITVTGYPKFVEVSLNSFSDSNKKSPVRSNYNKE